MHARLCRQQQTLGVLIVKGQTKLNTTAAPKLGRHCHLVKPEGLAHAALDVQAAHVLPVLLQKRHQKVDAHLDVDVQLLIGHSNIADGDTKAQHLLQLELDGSLDLIDLHDPKPNQQATPAFHA